MSDDTPPQPANPRKAVSIVTPALAAANNGNWRTADRWSHFLGELYAVNITKEWLPADTSPDLMIALHARRSAEAVADFSQTGKPIVLVLTGTDLYRDIQFDPSAQRSLALATHLVVLQQAGLDELPPAARQKCVVIEQSAPALPALEPRPDTFDLLLVGHLRAEKDPLTAARALKHLSATHVRLRAIGRSDDTDTGLPFTEMASVDPRIEMLGNQTHADTRDLIRRGRLLLLPSLMEGGANVLIEAVVSDTPVLASRISGSIGMLGADYPGYFPVGDDAALAELIERCMNEPTFVEMLRAHCRQRAYLFAPSREADLVRQLVSTTLSKTP
ncbi:MAG: selenoneine biosynthesis selenosugar synthase SenB [Burkholderiaceae bacterium]